jgi:hypothetical protein
MTRDELIALVSHTLAIATQRGDAPIVEICTELGSRLVAEGTEVVPTEQPEQPAPPPPEPEPCPVCAERRARRTAVQQKARAKKRGANATAKR